MYDGGKILVGVIIGVILLTFPIWWTHGSAPPRPEVKLPEKEKKVLVLYYYEDLTLKEIGEVLEVTESRISQLHTKAILRLRAKLSHIKKGIL